MLLNTFLGEAVRVSNEEIIFAAMDSKYFPEHWLEMSVCVVYFIPLNRKSTCRSVFQKEFLIMLCFVFVWPTVYGCWWREVIRFNLRLGLLYRWIIDSVLKVSVLGTIVYFLFLFVDVASTLYKTLADCQETFSFAIYGRNM